MRHHRTPPALAAALVLAAFACTGPPARAVEPVAAKSALQERADRFLDLVNSAYQAVYTVEQRALWEAATDVTPEPTASEAAGKARAAFNGNPAVINEAKALLAHGAELEPLTVRQLEHVLLNAAEGPMTNPELVSARIAAETRQASTLNGFTFTLDGKPITANEIDERLEQLTDLAQRRAVWEASKQSGPALKPGLVRLQSLRNGVARELGYHDYFALQVAGHDMTTAEMVKMNEDFLRELRPLYLQLHTWAKYQLARKYGQPVPKRIPAHWIRTAGRRNGTGARGLLQHGLRVQDPRRRVDSPDRRAVLDRHRHAAAAGVLLEELGPVRAEGDRRAQEEHPRLVLAHRPRRGHPLAPEHRAQRVLVRHGASRAGPRALHAVLRAPRGPVPAAERRQPVLPRGHGHRGGDGRAPDALPAVARPAAEGHEAGRRDHARCWPRRWRTPVHVLGLRRDDPLGGGRLRDELPPDQWNARWWQYVGDYQGVEPPGPRGEEFCDAATKTHIDDTPAYYYSYALATVLSYQLNDYIARHILKSDRATASSRVTRRWARSWRA